MKAERRESMKMIAFKAGPTLVAHARAAAAESGETLGEWIRRAMQRRLPKDVAAGVPMLGAKTGRPRKAVGA